MPAIPLRRGRTPDSEDDEVDGDALRQISRGRSNISNVTSRGSSGNKRARLDDGSDRSSLSPSPLLPNGYRNDQSATANGHMNGAAADGTDFQPGAIVRVKMQNFVTYTAAEFFPGPCLNMVIGPNGTGKSTLVCAICLGLGWGPQHLGRAKDVSEYVKHGFQDATIEIELAKQPGVHATNPIIRRHIKREGNKSQFSIDGKVTPLKAVLELARSFSIQIDNLCQFLPQDKVCEFAALTPVELLRSTQRAAAPERMLEWHDNLKTLRSGQKELQLRQATDKETLSNLDGRQRMLRADVERLRERAGVQEKVRLLESARPFVKYKQALKKHKEMKQRKIEAQKQLKELENDVEPSLRAVNEKQTYAGQIEQALKEKRRVVDRAETTTDDLLKAQKELEDRIKEKEQEVLAERDQEKARRKEKLRVEGNINRLEKQIEDSPVDFDPAAYNERVREKARRGKQLQDEVHALQDDQKRFATEGRECNVQLERTRKELQDLESQAGQQGNKLRQISRDTFAAWEWIRSHQDQFEHQVFGPPVVECSIKNPKYVDAIESLFQKNDFCCFTVQSRNDFKKLSDQLYKNMRLAEITIRTSTIGLDKYRPPVSEEQMRQYGFEGWALDFVQGPEPVLAMLCGVASGEISDRQYEALQQSSLSSWVSGKASFQITRRREYGPGATSTRVRDLKKAQVWTSQPVDDGAKRDLQRKINEHTDVFKELKKQIEEASDKIKQCRQDFTAVDEERNDLMKEKAEKQKAQAMFRALPTRLAQEKDKHADLEQTGSELKARLRTISDAIISLTMKQGQGAIDYARAVEKLQELHNDLFQAEIMHLEAVSDVEALSSRNRAVKDMLEQKRREVEQIATESEVASKTAKRSLSVVQEMLANPETSDQYREFVGTLPEDQSPEELENDISAEKARLELMHGSNPNAIVEFENRQKTIDQLREKLAKVDERLDASQAGIAEIRQMWEPELDELVHKISDAFAYSFEKIGCAGQVDVYKDEEDFDQWAIQIQVKFREHEPLSLLTSHRQSGGERAVSTIFYLMALQSLARAPFRVVDEINQGMDPRNERMVHERLVDIACGSENQTNTNGDGRPLAHTDPAQTSQYFLITPKLLSGLKYHKRMTVCCIVSGEFMPDTSEKGMVGRLDFGRLVDRRRNFDRARGLERDTPARSLLVDAA
ncbi:MAG: hypothetical protein M4579_001314 [Chaenotheca gracillima]|nr:MAG: hypothetical protein M4579_001314 [Chaenotheca gracillima]